MNTVSAQALKLFREHPIFSEVVSDQEAVAAIEKFVGMCHCPRRTMGSRSPQSPAFLPPILT